MKNSTEKFLVVHLLILKYFFEKYKHFIKIFLDKINTKLKVILKLIKFFKKGIKMKTAVL